MSKLKPKGTFFPDCMTFTDIVRRQLPITPDIIHLHWIAHFITPYDIWQLWNRFHAPIVWTMMDMAPVTGGCHYTGGCRGFTQHCGSCPAISSSDPHDISWRSWNRKDKWLRQLPITFVGATQWVLDAISQSSLFGQSPAVRIPYGMDTAVFRLFKKALARECLNLPKDGFIVFFGAEYQEEERKGMKYLIEALRCLAGKKNSTTRDLTLVIAGRRTMDFSGMFPFPFVNVGYLGDDRVLALAYQAADVYVCPSIDDAGPLMIPESLLCGTPVVAFEDCGGAKEYIQKGVSGYLARAKDPGDMACGIDTVLTAVRDGKITPESCRACAVNECSFDVQASRYIKLYEDLLCPSR